MNVISELGLSFVADGSDFVTEPFNLNGLVVMEVPTSHEGVSQDFDGGTLSVQRSYDGGTSWEIYTDSQANPASITAPNRAIAMTFGDFTLCRLFVTGATTPVLTAVMLNTKDRPKAA